MPDPMDLVQERVQRETDALVASAARATSPGATACVGADCGEPIAPERTALGARLCLDCQRGAEARNAHFARWGRR